MKHQEPWQCLRFTATRLRHSGADSIQLALIQFFNKGVQCNPPFRITNVYGVSPQAESANNVCDGQLGSKWLDFNKGCLELHFDDPYSTGIAFDTYRLATANDCPARDPITWILEGFRSTSTLQRSTLDSSVTFGQRVWEVLHHQICDNCVPVARHTFTAMFTVSKGAALAGCNRPILVSTLRPKVVSYLPLIHTEYHTMPRWIVIRVVRKVFTPVSTLVMAASTCAAHARKQKSNK
jgi:hypothetical protein